MSLTPSPIEVSLRVLLIEDNADEAALIAEHLERARVESIEVVVVSRLDDAVEACNESQFDAALLDLNLPDSRGVETISRLLEAVPGFPVVVLTGHADGSLAREAIRAGAQDYISKLELDRVRLVRALQHAVARARLRQQMRTLVEHGAHGVIVVGPDRDILYVNPAAERLLDSSSAALLGTVLELPIDLEVAVELAVGVRWLEVRANPLNWEGHPGLLVSLHDLTDQRLAIELRDRLERSERLAALGHLAAGVAHEINNPLSFVAANNSSLAGAIERIGEAVAGLRACEIRDRGGATVDIDELIAPETLDEIGELLEANDLGLARVSRIIRSLQRFGGVDVCAAPSISVNRAVAAACKEQSQAIKGRARFDVDLAEVPPVRGDFDALSRAVAALLSNAADAIASGAPERNRVQVRTRHRGARVVIEVVDSGVGIDADDLTRIFDPFFSTKENRTASSGLGLTVAAEAVRPQGGEIKVWSEPGSGSRFAIELPTTPTEAVAEGVEAQRLQVLVIDDEPILLKAYTRMLSHQHEIVTAGGGAEGLERLAEEPGIDVIICDLMMPDIDGASFYHQVAARWPKLSERIVFSTGGAYTDESQAFLDTVPNLRIHKPASVSTLLGSIDEAARR
jgi:signal transduction histidine kinase